MFLIIKIEVSKWIVTLIVINFVVSQSTTIQRGKNLTDLIRQLIASWWMPIIVVIMPLHVDLQLTLTEHDSQPTQKVFLDVSKFHRNITLVPGHSYEINCNNRMGGFGDQSNVWFHQFNNTQARLLATPINISSVVYAMKVDINNWKLVLQQFREANSGVYTCRGPSNNVSLDIRPGIVKPHV